MCLHHLALVPTYSTSIDLTCLNRSIRFILYFVLFSISAYMHPFYLSYLSFVQWFKNNRQSISWYKFENDEN